MFTYMLWTDDCLYDDMVKALIQVVLTPISIILDLIFSPFEIIAFILYKVRCIKWNKKFEKIEKEWENDRTRKL